MMQGFSGKSAFGYLATFLGGAFIMHMGSSFLNKVPTTPKRLTSAPIQSTTQVTTQTPDLTITDNESTSIAVSINDLQQSIQVPVIKEPEVKEEFKFIVGLKDETNRIFTSASQVEDWLNGSDAKFFSSLSVEFSKSLIADVDKLNNWLLRLGDVIFVRRLELAKVASSQVPITIDSSGSENEGDDEITEILSTTPSINLENYIRNPTFRRASIKQPDCGLTQLFVNKDNYTIKIKGLINAPSEYIKITQAIERVIHKPQQMANCAIPDLKKISIWLQEQQCELNPAQCQSVDFLLDDMTVTAKMQEQGEIKSNLQAILALVIFEEIDNLQAHQRSLISSERNKFLNDFYKIIEPDLKNAEEINQQKLMNKHREWIERELLEWTEKTKIRKILYNSLFI